MLKAGQGRTFIKRLTASLQPALALDFLGLSSSGPSLDPKITFTRASSGTYFGSDGLLKTAAVDVPRFDYNQSVPVGATGAKLNVGVPALSDLGTIQPTSGAVSVTNGAIRVYTADGTLAQFQDAGSFWLNGTGVTIGKTYSITFDLVVATGTALLQQAASGTTAGSYTTSGSYSAYITSVPGSPLFVFKRQSGVTDFTVSNISIKEAIFAPRGLLIEEARTNLCTFSSDHSNAAWTKANTSVSRTAVGLDGSANGADIITATSGSNSNIVNTSMASLALSTTYTKYVIAKAGTTPNLIFQKSDNGVLTLVRFNLSTGTVAANTTGGTASMTNLGDGKWLCALTYTTGATGGQDIATDYIDTYGAASGNTNLTIYHTQLEVGAFATSIIPTTTAAVTRAVDTAVMTGANFSSWFNAAQGTLIAEAQTLGSASVRGVASINDGTANNKMDLRLRAGVLSIASIAGTGVWNLSGVTSDNNVHKMALAYQSANNAATADGAVPSTSAQATIPTVNALDIGGLDMSGSLKLNGYIRRLSYYNTRLSDAQLQSLTT